MSFGGMQRVSESVLHTRPKAVQFTLFTNEDIRKLAVCKIISSTSFDQLGHPLPGGLYDKRLGMLYIDLITVQMNYAIHSRF